VQDCCLCNCLGTVTETCLRTLRARYDAATQAPAGEVQAKQKEVLAVMAWDDNQGKQSHWCVKAVQLITGAGADRVRKVLNATADGQTSKVNDVHGMILHRRQVCQWESMVGWGDGEHLRALGTVV